MFHIWLAGRVVGRTEFYSCLHAKAFTERLFTVVAVDVSDWGQWRTRRSPSSSMIETSCRDSWVEVLGARSLWQS